MSRPKKSPVSDLITRFLELNEGRNSSEVARLYGIDGSYIGRWRKGERPSRLQEETRKKLAAAVGSEGPGNDGTLLAFAAGVLWGIERDARHMAATAAAARARLGYSDGQASRARRLTPQELAALEAEVHGSGAGPDVHPAPKRASGE